MNEDSQHSVATQLRELDIGPFSIDVLSDGSRGGTRGGLPPLFWVKKEEMTEGRRAGWASKIDLDPFLAQSLDPPLVLLVFPIKIRHFFCGLFETVL